MAQDFYLASYGVVERCAARSRAHLALALEQNATVTAFRANVKMHPRSSIHLLSISYPSPIHPQYMLKTSSIHTRHEMFVLKIRTSFYTTNKFYIALHKRF